MAGRVDCAIAHTKLSYPVLVYTQKEQEHDFEMVGHDHDVDANDGGEVVCQERFHIDAIAEWIATRLVGRVEVLCPNCNQHLDGIRLDITKVFPDEEEAPYRMVGSPQVLALATEIARQFRDSSLVDGVPRVQELTIHQMIAMRDRLIQPIVPLPQDDGECVFDDCVSKAGPFALIAGVAFAFYSVVNFIFTPAGASDEPKKNQYRSHGTFADLGYLETKI